LAAGIVNVMVRAAHPSIVLLFASTLAVMAPARDAHAGESVRLAYVRADGAEQCADEKGLRLAIAVRLGYDPFVAYAPKTVHADIAREGARLRARVYLAGEDGRARGTRVLFAPQGDCDKLLAAVALAVSIAIDPMNTGADGAPPTDVKETTRDSSDAPRVDRANDTPAAALLSAPPGDARSTAAPQPETSDRDAAVGGPRADGPSSRFDGAGGLGTVFSTGTSPDVAVGVAASFRVGWRSASLGIEARYQFPDARAAEVGRGAVETTALLVSLEPCWRLSPFAICALATVGSLLGAGKDISQPAEQSTFYWGAGGRGAVEVVLAAPLSLRGHVDLVGNGTRPFLAIDNREVWRLSAISAAAGVDLVAQFW
jgi:hypothetical protein